DKTFITNGLWLQECPLLPTQDSSALWTTQPKAFNLNTKEGFNEKENGIISLTLIVTGVQQSGPFAMLPSKPILSNISVDETVLSEAESKLFFKRVDYFLGKEETWVDCDSAIQFATKHNYQTNYYTVNGGVFGHFPYICGDNYFGVEDQKPDYFEKRK
ncbi:MAG: hypothetical protein Q7J31_04780, partial [Syntrophales bacterium]|nr:hypothetical protein [Syntrophales bacterium]